MLPDSLTTGGTFSFLDLLEGLGPLLRAPGPLLRALGPLGDAQIENRRRCSRFPRASVKYHLWSVPPFAPVPDVQNCEHGSRGENGKKRRRRSTSQNNKNSCFSAKTTCGGGCPAGFLAVFSTGKNLHEGAPKAPLPSKPPSATWRREVRLEALAAPTHTRWF